MRSSGEQFAGGFGFRHDQNFAQGRAADRMAEAVGAFLPMRRSRSSSTHIMSLIWTKPRIWSHGLAINGDARALRGGEHAHAPRPAWLRREACACPGADTMISRTCNLAQFNRAEDEFFFPGGEQAPFARLLDLDLQFFGGVGHAVTAGSHESPRAFTMRPEAPSSRSMAHRNVFRNHRNGRATMQRDALRPGKTDRFGHQFAQDHVNGAEEHERDGQSDRVNKQQSSNAAVCGHDVLNETR